MEIRARHNNKLLRFTLNHPGYVFTERQHSPTGPRAVSSFEHRGQTFFTFVLGGSEKTVSESMKKKKIKKRTKHLKAVSLYLCFAYSKIPSKHDLWHWNLWHWVNYPLPPPANQRPAVRHRGRRSCPQSRLPNFQILIPKHHWGYGSGLSLSPVWASLCSL